MESAAQTICVMAVLKKRQQLAYLNNKLASHPLRISKVSPHTMFTMNVVVVMFPITCSKLSPCLNFHGI